PSDPTLSDDFLGALAFYALKLYRHTADTLEPLYNRYPRLRCNFSNSVYPTATFNLGPQVVTLEHVDCANLPHGWCSIWAGGSFDPQTGGHFVFYDLKLMVEFPPGSTILVPSSTLRHGNTGLPHDAKRVSITQYMLGGLTRWVCYGYRPVKSLTPEERWRIDGPPGSRIEWAVGQWSLVGELLEDRLHCFGAAA
ncbi:hypothetical protein HYDPIDRAFT_101570, partial [Hydnomerulius pinastri MD-312]